MDPIVKQDKERGSNKLEFLKLEEGWSESKDNKLHGNGMALSYNGMLLQNQQLLLFGGRSNKDENKNLIQIDLDIKKQFLPAVKLAYQIKLYQYYFFSNNLFVTGLNAHKMVG